MSSLKEITVEVKEKLDYIKPMKDILKKKKDESMNLKTMSKDLKNVRTEVELDQMIETLENRIAHESMSLADEKNIIKSIKELKAKRPEVKDYEAKMKVHTEVTNATKTDNEELEKSLQASRGEVDVLKMQQQVQYEVFKSHIFSNIWCNNSDFSFVCSFL